MQSLKLREMIIGAALAAAIAAASGCTGDGPVESGPAYKEIPVQKGTIEIAVSANGVVRPIDRVEMKSKASGMIVELPIEEGDFVRKGALIARLDQKDERAAVEQARADLDIANAELTQAQRAFDRRDLLFQRNYISEEERDQIEYNLAAAKGKLVRAQTEYERAQERLADATVRAPIDGIILQKYVEEGQIIASGISNVSGGTPIADIADMTRVQVEAGIDEVDIGKVAVGQVASVTADAYPDLKFHGTVIRIAPEAKIEQNVTLFDIIVEVGNTDGKLKSGMNAAVEITIARKDSVLLVPEIALQPPKKDQQKDANTRMVLLKRGDKLVPQQVEIGLSDFRNAEIVSGLKEGDVLAVPMTSRLKEENERMEDRIRSSRTFGTSARTNNRASNP